jgi:enoyl-CoA hydratase
LSLVGVDVSDRVAVLTLDDPARRNALSAGMVGEIVAAMEDVERGDAVGAVVVTGAPPAFCAGADLSELGRERRGPGLRSIYEGFLRVARSPLPTVAAVNGPAVGAGMNLALACDVRVASRSARFDSRFLRLGLHPGGGHTWMLRRLAGPQTASAMALFGEVLDGERAAHTGVAWRCVDDGDLLGAARELAARAADVPSALARRAKQTLSAMAAIADHDEAVAVELDAQVWSFEQPEFAARVAAMRRQVGRGS